MSQPSESAHDRRALRAAKRAERRAVPPEQRLHCASLVARHVDRTFHLRAGMRIALYASMPEELDTSALLLLARRRGCRVYLPRIEHYGAARMRFVEIGALGSARAGGSRRNRFGIAEPLGAEILGARWLDLAFVPLVAFDARGMRLGMGAGFYDRAFAFRRLRRTWRGPRLVGLAYSLQQVAHIEPAAHDVPLDAVVTEKGVIQCDIG